MQPPHPTLLLTASVLTQVDYDWHHIPAPGAAAAVAAALEPPLKQLSRRGSENTQPSPAPALAAATRPRTALAGVGNTLAAEGAAPRAVSKGLKDHVPDLDVLNRDKVPAPPPLLCGDTQLARRPRLSPARVGVADDARS